MKWRAGTRMTPIGVDVGGRQFKAVQLRRAGARWEVHAAAAFPRLRPHAPLEADEARRLGDVLYRQGFAGNRLVLAAPADKLLSANLELPPRSSGAPVEQLARIELARANRCEPQTLELACWELPGAGRPHGAARMLAVACPHADADAYLDLFEGQGLEVVALDTHACALARACQAIMAAAPGVAAVLDVGWSAAEVVLLYQGVMVYERRLAEGGLAPLHEQVRAQLSLSVDEADYLFSTLGLEPGGRHNRASDLPEVRRRLAAHFECLAAELRESLSYAEHCYQDQPVHRLLLVGGGAAMAGMAPHLADALGIEVQVVMPKDLADCPPELLGRCGDPILTVALGLALAEEGAA